MPTSNSELKHSMIFQKILKERTMWSSKNGNRLIQNSNKKWTMNINKKMNNTNKTFKNGKLNTMFKKKTSKEKAKKSKTLMTSKTKSQ